MEKISKEEIDQEIKHLESQKDQLEKEEKLRQTKAWKLSAEIKYLKEQRDQLSQEIIQRNCELAKLCTHEKVRTENRSYEGGYLDRAEYWTDYFCEVCGMKIDEKVEYGGFG